MVNDASRRMEYRGYDSVLAVLRRLEGHFTLVFANADEPGTIICRPPLHPAGDRRRGRRDVRRLGRGRVRRATRDAVELGQDQAVVLTADGRRPTPTRSGRRPYIYGSASSQTGSQKPWVWPRFAMHRIEAA
jgi:hypothetical protein